MAIFKILRSKSTTSTEVSACVQLSKDVHAQKRHMETSKEVNRIEMNHNFQPLYCSAPLFAPVDKHRMVRALERRSTYLEASSVNRRLISQISDTSVDHRYL